MNGVHSTPSQTRLLFADSKNRDVQLYPSGNSYVLHLTTPIKDIERVDLVSARVPNTMFNLTHGSNVLAVNSSNVSMNPGFYLVYGLAAALTTATLTTATLTLEYLVNEGHFLFSSTTSFTIFIHSQELATMLGLVRGSLLTSALAGPTDPAYTGKYILRSSTLVDLSLNEYVFLDIDELRTPTHVDTGSLQGNTGTVSGSNANRNFAPVIMDVGSACIKNFHEHKDYRVSVEYPEPIASLQRLTVRWVDKSGAPLERHAREPRSRNLFKHPVLDGYETEPSLLDLVYSRHGANHLGRYARRVLGRHARRHRAVRQEVDARDDAFGRAVETHEIIGFPRNVGVDPNDLLVRGVAERTSLGRVEVPSPGGSRRGQFPRMVHQGRVRVRLILVLQ